MMENKIPCKICLNGSSVHLCETPNEHGPVSVISHYRCPDCGSVFVGNQIGIDDLDEAYGDMDAKEYFAQVESETRRKFATAIDHLGRLVGRADHIIDIGTGDGLFIETLSERGYENLHAHEIPKMDLSKIKGIARKVYQDFDYQAIPSDSFDAVTMLDLIEHVIDPRHLLQNCGRVLKKGGAVYFHTPVVTRTDRFMHLVQKAPVIGAAGRIWQRGRTSIFHLQNFTEKSLRMLLEECGFTDIDIKVGNELSWPITLYVRVYLLEKQGLPGFLAPLFYPAMRILLGTDFFNANKAIASARKA